MSDSGNVVLPEINPLIPNGIENFVPSCIVCRNPVPLKRATGRAKDTCSPECQKVRQAYRRWVVRRTKCPNCYHPSTPEERADFLRWRKDRGMLREKGGRPPVKLRQTLAEAIATLREYMAPEDADLGSAIERLQKVLDTEMAKV